MSRGPEGRFQDRWLGIIRSQGCVCQKFNDLFSEGIPDTLVKLPVATPWGVRTPWVELKAIERWPKRETTKLPKKSKPTSAQMRWMNSFATDSAPCWVVLNTPDGWLAVDHSVVEKAWSLPISDVRLLLVKEKPTVGRVMRSIREN